MVILFCIKKKTSQATSRAISIFQKVVFSCFAVLDYDSHFAGVIMLARHSWYVVAISPFLDISDLAVLCGVHSHLESLVHRIKLAAAAITKFKELRFVRRFPNPPSMVVLSFSNFKGDVEEWEKTVLSSLRNQAFSSVLLDRAWLSRSFSQREGRGNLNLSRFAKTLSTRKSFLPKISFTNSAVDAVSADGLYRDHIDSELAHGAHFYKFHACLSRHF